VKTIREANLSGANLRDANLSVANLSVANLSDADLSDADLGGANLSGANLRDADLSGANLSDADLRDADLRDAEFMGAKFYGKGGTKSLKQSQLKDFLAALGFVIEDTPVQEKVRDTVAKVPVATNEIVGKKIKNKIAGVVVEVEIVE
jgi:uncharacterized protein YjbI with pentapeptide repeats